MLRGCRNPHDEPPLEFKYDVYLPCLKTLSTSYYQMIRPAFNTHVTPK
jgi:hypothetical protein